MAGHALRRPSAERLQHRIEAAGNVTTVSPALLFFTILPVKITGLFRHAAKKRGDSRTKPGLSGS